MPFGYTVNESLGTNQTEFDVEVANRAHEPDLSSILWIYCGPVIFFIGLIGNILILMVMSRKRMCGHSTSVYLRWMAVADICVLISGMIPEWLEAMDVIIFKEISGNTCKTEKFIFYTSGDTSIWILTVFTLDRFYALVFPFSKKDICLPRRAKYNALIVLLLAMLKNVHVVFTRGTEIVAIPGTNETWIDNCGIAIPSAKYFEKFVRPWVVFAVVNVVPFLILVVCNVVIIKVILGIRKMHSHQTLTPQKQKNLVQMSLMCVSASVCFLVCLTPSVVMYIGKPYWKKKNIDNFQYDVAKAINNQLTFINHSANFFLYCVSGKRFRTELADLFRGRGGLEGNYSSPFVSARTKGHVKRIKDTSLTGSAKTRTPAGRGNDGGSPEKYLLLKERKGQES